MDIRSDRRFEFDHDRATVWTALTHVERYPIWWPWLECDGVALAEGERWTCRVDPPLLYSLDFELHVAEVVAERFVRAELTGDLVGVARLTLDGGDDDEACTVRLESIARGDRRPGAVGGPLRRPDRPVRARLGARHGRPPVSIGARRSLNLLRWPASTSAHVPADS